MPKLLIVKGCATVAEGRHRRREVTLPNNNCKELKLKVVSGMSESEMRIVAQQDSCGEWNLLRLTVVLLRHYIGAIASLIIRHCERVNGKETLLRRTLPEYPR